MKNRLKKVFPNYEFLLCRLRFCSVLGGLILFLFPLYGQKQLDVNALPVIHSEYISCSSEAEDITDWWKSFEDPNLNILEELAIKNNYDIRASLSRIEASRQMLKQAYSGYFPTVDVFAGFDVNKDSGREDKPYGHVPTSSFFNVGANVSWEIDLFGRIKQKAKSGKISVNISRLDYESLLVSLTAEVAQNYGALCMYHQQLLIANAHLKSQIEMFDIVKDRYKAGLISKLDVAQSENTVNSTKLKIPMLEAQQAVVKNSLAVLCGVSPGELDSLLDANVQPTLRIPEAIGQPADILRNRPDIAMAEQHIAATAEELGIAKKDYLPSLSINASVGTSSHDLKGLFGQHSLNFAVTPQLTWTLFEGLSRRANVAEKRALMEAQIETYNSSVLTALQEVDNAIVNYTAARKELTLYDNALATSREMLLLSIDRYKLGLANYSDVASSQVAYLSYQTSLLTSRNNCFNSLVALYKALGGGWKNNLAKK